MTTLAERRPKDMADPTYWNDGTDEIEINWSADDTVATVSMTFGGERKRLRLTVHQLALLREFLDANVE